MKIVLKKRPIHRQISILILFSLCITLLFGCTGSKLERLIMEAIRTEGEEQFDQLMDELFAEDVVSDSLTLNYVLADPGSFGIERLSPATFGETTTADTIRRSREENLELTDRLKRFRVDELRPDQRIVYDILTRNLELLEVLEGKEEYAYYLGVFYPTSGLHVQLPVLLAEFRFYSIDDIEAYLELLEDTWRYFAGQIEFERERARRGFFMSETNVDKVIGHCESFLENTEENLLILVFDDKIDGFEGLGDAQSLQYKEKNRELVLGNVLPAYDELLKVMRELRGQGAGPGGLYSFPDGKEYSQAYLQYRTGSDRRPAQVEALLIDWMRRVSMSITDMITRNPELGEGFIDGTLGQIHYAAPESYLIELEQAITRDFPAMRPVQYAVREVHESLQEFMSPAFYLIPALDDYNDNVIYINPGTEMDELGMFTTLAHEGYPGHLYQNVYYLQQSPHPVRTMINHLGYIEGWATYAEMTSYSYAGLSEDEAILMQSSRLFDLLFLSRIDLGVNALGWDIDRVASMLGQFGIEDPEVAEEVYQTVIGYPLHYMPYSLGYLEMMSLREEAMEALGYDFELIEFHRFILDIGPAPFSLIRTFMRDWIQERSPGALAPAA